MDLIAQVYGDDLKEHKYNDDGLTHLIFKNKPDQLLQLHFQMYDTWDKIKMKMNKLRDSDGLCVVCCMMEKGKKKIVRRPCEGCDCGHTFRAVEIETLTFVCETCCDYACRDCRLKFGVKESKCPVCRECLNAYIHKHEGTKCPCEDDNE